MTPSASITFGDELVRIITPAQIFEMARTDAPAALPTILHTLLTSLPG